MIVAILALAFCAAAGAAQTTSKRTTLDIYVVDVEGGNAVLFVTPANESVLIDSGNGGAAAVRDAERIMAAAKDAGLTKIDHLITTHYHADHVGGLPELARRIPIRNFIDHGANVQPGPNIDPVMQQYAELQAKAKHIVAKAGDRIPRAGLEVRIVNSAGKTITAPLPGAGKPNPYCGAFKFALFEPVALNAA